MGRTRSTYTGGEKHNILVGKRILGRTRHRLDDNIKMDLKEIGCETWTGFNWLRVGSNGGLL
jgi:hypothetical protein